ncbi:PREDICTED: SLAM family member 9-like [Cyprinodon variegatus]|uniref:SLAM family member 9-like n=1 Tax=Cyprinodon variegatus TaxID=28743 RepID=UPI00074291C4|nr:PREDICTED: SLAM family member 9-like [Cyprinodon variegatus]
MTMDALKCVFLLCFWSFTGVTSTDSPVMLYGLRNGSVCLHVRKTPSHTKGDWMFGETVITNGNEINPNYKGRVTFSPKNLTLCINQLRVKDTGIFTFSYLKNFTRTSESYQVIVEDIVPRPVMILTPENPSNISMGFCNFTVNCSIQHVWLSSNCNKDGCTTTQRSLKNFNISIHTDNSTVTCSGNNNVSTNNISEKISAICK